MSKKSSKAPNALWGGRFAGAPTEALERNYLTVTMTSTDYAYAGPDLRWTISHLTDRVAIEP